MDIACAIPGIVSPCCILVEFINAPVAINNIFFIFFSLLLGFAKLNKRIGFQERNLILFIVLMIK